MNTIQPKPTEPFGHSTDIKLQSVGTEHYASFIVNNSLECTAVVEYGSGKGQTVVICGAGPSLRDTAAEWCSKGHQVWGCNSALTWLADNGHKVTHGFTVDQTPHMIVEWKSAPEVEYILASTVHPFLTEHLKGRGRSIRWFHNYVGLKGAPVVFADCADCDWVGDTGPSTCPLCAGSNVREFQTSFEEWTYATCFPGTFIAGSGLNTVTRAVDTALFMGFKRIIVLGADCALRTTAKYPHLDINSPAHHEWLREHTVMHTDGGHALVSNQSCLTLAGVIDGREWVSKPDMLVTAVCLVQMKRALGSRLSVIGDTLPKALMGKDDAFLDRLPSLTASDGTPMRYALPEFLQNA